MPKIDEYHSDASEVESDNYDDDDEVAASDDLPQEAWEAAGFPEGGLPPSALNFTVKPGDTLLDKIPGSSLTEEVDPELQMGETFRAIMLIIPFSFLYLAMDIMIHQQYAQHPTVSDEFWRMLNAVPLLSILIYVANKHVNNPLFQYALAGLSTVAGSRLIYVINRAGWTIVIRQAPPLAVLWTWSVTQLDLGKALASLLALYGWVWWHGLKLIT